MKKLSEMEMRAREGTPLAQDLIPPLPPVAASLHDRFLLSHCSSCFRTLKNPSTALSCASCTSSISYCSLPCSASDSNLHSSSGECRLLRRYPPSTWHSSDSSDIRTALRLLQTLASPIVAPPSSHRIGWLSTCGLDEVLAPGSDIGERIREGAVLMRRVRGEEEEDGERREEKALWAVMTNAVEVQVSEVGALGIGVYGPFFSWFNHSCSPNASYRFQVASLNESLGSFDLRSFGVLPVSDEESSATWKTWLYGGINLMQGLYQHGPRVVVRSIKPITKGEEVCITYIDLLQPKVMRHYDLWYKYRFVCSCERCSTSPEMYIDYILNCDARGLVDNQFNYDDAECDEITDYFDQTIAEYMSDGRPEACYKKLEGMLSKIFQDSALEEPSKSNIRLHPLHYLSLNAYITQSSVCRIMSSNSLASISDKSISFDPSKMSRAAAAYSLLLAGATHHLFMSEPSLITGTAVFWVSAGKSLIDFLRSSSEEELNLILLHHYPFMMDDLKKATMIFVKCMSKNLTKSWSFMIRDLPYMENIRSPVDFRWLGIVNDCQIPDGKSSFTDFCVCSERMISEEYRNFAQLAVCCLSYGRYLAVLCWGEQNYLVDKVGVLLHGLEK